MKTLLVLTVAFLVGTCPMSQHALAEQATLPSVGRTELLRQDLSAPGREVLHVLVDFAQGVEAPRHSHPGEELVYVVEGLLEYTLDGQPPIILKEGGTLFIPNGVVHSARNVGDGPAVELATYIVEKGQPLVVLSD